MGQCTIKWTKPGKRSSANNHETLAYSYGCLSIDQNWSIFSSWCKMGTWNWQGLHVLSSFACVGPHLTWSVNDKPTYLPLHFSAATSRTHPKNACLEIRTTTHWSIVYNTTTHWSSYKFTLQFIQFLVDVHLHWIPIVSMQMSVHRIKQKMPTKESFHKESQWPNGQLQDWNPVNERIFCIIQCHQDCFTDSTVANAL